ncbi:Gfo/Idh/MocA family protein [Deinococcus maricopensis]|uniref:Oxidoreductase domain protein n=1 Tax=Deinococcus maricopensis (strain DSM 21211 / LMG 22137 / NRRL B-23946 / LB-34) TaxID=709986 RepID=E8U3G9_DEIML|nr:Gfo/Idh/MocA family oxidoreductase [Deinococcus maricopensis]ADV65840.1 oxidoreductase domain protein [Deinococcus maricopensis DSM 21211]
MNPIDPYRAAVVGVGFIGAAHIEALRRLGVPIAGVLGRDAGPSAARAQALGLRAYGSYDELLADPDVHVIHDCGPNDVHADLNVRALRAGKHVLSEKPLGVTAAECAAQLRAAQDANRLHGVNFTYRGYAAVQQLRDLVQSGALGELRYVRGHYLQDWLLFPTDHNWRTEAPAAETRAVADIGSHLADLTRYVTGRALERVLARFSRMHDTRVRPAHGAVTFAAGDGEGTPYPVQTEDQASIWVDCAGGVRATFELSQVAAGHKNDLEIELFGTQGSARWRQERPEELLLGSRRDERVLRLKDPAHPFTHYPPGHPEGVPDAITNVIRAFYATLRGETQPYPTFEDGLAAAQFTDAAYLSHTRGDWVNVPATPQEAL